MYTEIQAVLRELASWFVYLLRKLPKAFRSCPDSTYYERDGRQSTARWTNLSRGEKL